MRPSVTHLSSSLFQALQSHTQSQILMEDSVFIITERLSSLQSFLVSLKEVNLSSEHILKCQDFKMFIQCCLGARADNLQMTDFAKKRKLLSL